MKIGNTQPRLLCATAMLAWCPALTAAQAYPNKTMRIIVPIGTGGAQDFVARLVAQPLAIAVGQQIIVDNRPGAGGIIGTALAAKAMPDGYTLVLVAASYTAQPGLYTKLPYDPVKDFAPITQLGGQAYLLLVHPSVPAKSIKEFIAMAKADRGKLSYGSTGNGELSNLAMELLKTLGDFDAVHVPYKGSAAAMGLLAREVDAFFPAIASGMPHVKSGKARLLAVTTLRRATLLPEIPTIAESGFPGYEVNGWYGLLAPASTPREVIAKLNLEVAKVLELPSVKVAQLNSGRSLVPGGNSPEDFAANIKTEIARWEKVIKLAGIKLD